MSADHIGVVTDTIDDICKTIDFIWDVKERNLKGYEIPEFVLTTLVQIFDSDMEHRLHEEDAGIQGIFADQRNLMNRLAKGGSNNLFSLVSNYFFISGKVQDAIYAEYLKDAKAALNETDRWPAKDTEARQKQVGAVKALIEAFGIKFPDELLTSLETMTTPSPKLMGQTIFEVLCRFRALHGAFPYTSSTNRTRLDMQKEYWQYVKDNPRNGVSLYRLLTIRDKQDIWADNKSKNNPWLYLQEKMSDFVHGDIDTRPDPKKLLELLWGFVSREKLGGSWAQNPMAALQFWKSGWPWAVLLKGTVDAKDVNWILTFLLALQHSAEYELRIYSSARIVVDNIGVIAPPTEVNSKKKAMYTKVKRYTNVYSLHNLEELDADIALVPIHEKIKYRNKILSRRLIKWIHPDPEEGMA